MLSQLGWVACLSSSAEMMGYDGQRQVAAGCDRQAMRPELLLIALSAAFGVATVFFVVLNEQNSPRLARVHSWPAPVRAALALALRQDQDEGDCKSCVHGPGGYVLALETESTGPTKRPSLRVAQRAVRVLIPRVWGRCRPSAGRVAPSSRFGVWLALSTRCDAGSR